MLVKRFARPVRVPTAEDGRIGMSGERTIDLRVEADDAGGRLDRWLTAVVEDLSRNRLQALIDEGQVIGPGGIVVRDAAKKVRAGDVYTLTVPPPVPAKPVPEDIPLVVLYEDDDLIVIDKPAGLVVHPAPGHATGTLVHALLHHCAGSLSGIGGVTRPGIVHRLDKDTSGIMVCAKSDAAHQGLVEQFQVHSIERAYMAVVWGVPSPKAGRIETRIGRDPRNRQRMAVVENGGKLAITDYTLIRPVGSQASLVDCQLFTGRTHQIRVHMTSMGNPLVGDPVYHSRASARLLRNPVIQTAVGTYRNQALQAYLLGFTHPVSSQKLRFKINISNNINDLMCILEQI